MTEQIQVDMIVRAIEQGFGKLQSEMGKTTSAVDKVEKSAKRTNLSLTDLKSGLEMAGRAAQQIYNFAKAGAELEFTRGKFDRLSEAIGTTSTALLVDLNKATRGMYSDSQLIANATDFVALRLAKTSDQVIRLSRVSAALNMDMNQLVLTLANKTTMRFDQLGVAIDGFDEKLKELEASGMDVNAAFTEAFLQQAEKQVSRVGEAADTTAGSFMRMEAAWGNIKDTMAMGAAPKGAAFLELLLKMMQGDFKQANASDFINDFFAGSMWETKAHEAERVIGEWGGKEEYLAAVTKNRLIPSLDDLSGGIDTLKYKSSLAADELMRQKDATEQMARVTEIATRYAKKMAEVQGELASAQQALADAQENWKEGAGGDAAGMLEDAGVKGTRYKDALGVIDEVMGTGLVNQYEYNAALEAASKEYAKTGDLEAYKTKLDELKGTFMPMAEEVEKATEKVKLLQAALDLLPQSKTLFINIVTGQSATGGQTIPGGAFSPEGAPHHSGGPVAAGIPFRALPGEVLVQSGSDGMVIPGNHGGGTVINYYNNFNTQGATALGLAQQASMRRARLNASM